MRERYESLCSNELKSSPIGKEQVGNVQSNRSLSEVCSLKIDQVVACPRPPGYGDET